MKSTQAMRDRIRELMSREQDDYDRAVECVLDDLESLMSAPAQSSQVTIKVIASALRIALDSFERDVRIDSLTENEIMHLARVAQVASQPSPTATVEPLTSALEHLTDLGERAPTTNQETTP